MIHQRNIRKTVLPNGLTILTERMEHVRSVAMGVWIKAGSRHESAEINGISHFVEHMVFKGTRSRSAQRIAREVDAIGGNLDAFTGKESICLNIKVLDEHVGQALDVLSDMIHARPFLAMLFVAACLPAHAQWEMQNSNTKADLRGIHAVGGGVAWASGSKGTVLRTEDGGYVWQTCAMPPGAEQLDFRSIWAWDAQNAIVMAC